MSFEEISHTADVKIRARALTLNALFTDAFLALMQVMYGTDRNEGIIKEIRIESDNIESLLCDFLSEVLFIADVEGLVFSRADIAIYGLHLTAVLNGESFDPLRHSSGTEVKGISYSGLVIQKDANGYMLDILFDV
ncbi:MAG: archease [Methanoregula sp.]|nr:archease [Methanoregula sp.]MDP2797657.1 archease [Methanoregula sp.]